MLELLDLKKQYFFYNKYHSNGCNKLIHYLCIPILVFTLFILLNYIPYYYKIDYLENYSIKDVSYNLINSNTTLDHIIIINTSSCLYVLYMIYYLILNIITGIISIPIYGTILITSNYLVYNYYNRSWVGALFFQCISWLFQFMGHYYFENNRPALCDSLFKSILIAPFFVIFDLLHICGYKKNYFKNELLKELL